MQFEPNSYAMSKLKEKLEKRCAGAKLVAKLELEATLNSQRKAKPKR